MIYFGFTFDGSKNLPSMEYTRSREWLESILHLLLSTHMGTWNMKKLSAALVTMTVANYYNRICDDCDYRH